MSRTGTKPDEASGDLLQLLTLLNEQLLIELGKPLPYSEFLPKVPTARCPAAHNRALLDRSGEES